MDIIEVCQRDISEKREEIERLLELARTETWRTEVDHAHTRKCVDELKLQIAKLELDIRDYRELEAKW